MSNQTIIAFSEKVLSDADLQARLRAAADSHGKVPPPEVVHIAEDAGYHFTVEQLKAEPHSELTDQELEAVAGGLKIGSSAAMGLLLDVNQLDKNIGSSFPK